MLILARTRMNQEKDIPLINIKEAGMIKVMGEVVVILMVKLKSSQKIPHFNACLHFSINLVIL